ncbi:MAG: hypothetical protein H7Z37_14535 [Pyrinomonadaceae bacterium]|nr:hypothetical protein [Pyrinomonadaceae bacterium]
MRGKSLENRSSNELMPSFRSGEFNPNATAKYKSRKSLWLMNIAYFSATCVVLLILFFVTWTVFHENEEDAAWIPAGIVAVAFFSASIAAREIILRRFQNRQLLQHERMEKRASFAGIRNGKLTLEQNAAILRRIKRKSDAANTVQDTPENHWELFNLSSEYLERIERELQNVHVGSPRLPALRKGQEQIQVLQKHHLLHWASETSQNLTREAQVRVNMNEKIETAQRALEILQTASRFYPNERQLSESTSAIKEFIASIRVGHWVEAAERAVFKGHLKKAVDLYRDALFDLSRETIDENERDKIKKRILAEIIRLENDLHREKASRKHLSPKT